MINLILLYACSVENIVGVIPSAAEGGVEESVFNRFLHFAMLCIASVEMTYGLFNRANILVNIIRKSETKGPQSHNVGLKNRAIWRWIWI